MDYTKAAMSKILGVRHHNVVFPEKNNTEK